MRMGAARPSGLSRVLKFPKGFLSIQTSSPGGAGRSTVLRWLKVAEFRLVWSLRFNSSTEARPSEMTASLGFRIWCSCFRLKV